MDLRKALWFSSLSLMLAAALPLAAQSGCVDSPEDPTIILALVGGAAAVFATLRLTRKPQ